MRSSSGAVQLTGHSCTVHLYTTVQEHFRLHEKVRHWLLIRVCLISNKSIDFLNIFAIKERNIDGYYGFVRKRREHIKETIFTSIYWLA